MKLHILKLLTGYKMAKILIVTVDKGIYAGITKLFCFFKMT